MSGIERITLCLNTEDPEQKALYDFVTCLPNGKKRNASAFLKILVDREYQRYLAERGRQQKKTQEASSVDVLKTKNGGIKYQVKKDLFN